MSTGPVFRESLLEARQRLQRGREEIKQQHRTGSPGIQICTRLTDLLDGVILELYEAALADLWPAGSEEFREQIALVAHGGYGRRDVAPYSDVDLMILQAPGTDQSVLPLASRLMRDLFDAGLELGQSVRTPDQACRLAAEDATVCTSLMESRLLAGSEKLFRAFTERFQRRTHARRKGLFNAILDARRNERLQFGETVYLLEPNIKRSRGGLRDLQLLRWLGFACYGTTDPDAMQLMGKLSKDDQRTLRDASEYLLRLRNELHFHAGKCNDVLDRSEQVRLAELYRYEGTHGILPVEQFMREYFHHTRGVRSVVSGFTASARPGQGLSRLWGTLFSHQVDGDYRVTLKQIVATDRGLQKLQTDLSEVLH
ncbi:MAG TPA: [protein-PII] uridylyltransferase, partial [Pirellulales bacterium]|nr:[protein-PII] uridylyltransferase [Pirellulales bacterium]